MTECWQQLWPVDKLPTHGNGANESTSSGTEEGRGVSNAQQALLLDEGLDLIRKTTIVQFHIVLQNEPSNGTCRFILGLQFGEDKNEIVVEVGVLIQGLQFLCVSYLCGV